MNMEVVKIMAPYFTSILGAVVAIGIAVYNNSSKSKAIQNKLSIVDEESKAIRKNLSEVDEETRAIQNKISEVNEETRAIQNKLSEANEETRAIQSKLSEVDEELHGLKDNHFFHLGEYLKKLNAFLYRGKLMDDVERAEMDFLAAGVSGKI
jgi:septal ring factor EnvC (AmiA/AmiB activator)